MNLLTMCFEFFKTGLFAVGGGLATLPFLTQMQERYGWFTAEELAKALSEYIQLFDRLMKGYLSGRYDDHDVEAAYYSQLLNAPIHV